MKQENNNHAAMLGVQHPLMLGYVVQPQKPGSKAIWNKVGTAWSHSDGQGYDVQMDALPVNGRLVLRVVTDEVQPQNEFMGRSIR